MLLPNDFIHRLRALKLRRTKGFGSNSDKILLQWAVVLFFGLLLVLLAFIYAIYRFSYWNNIENNLSSDTISKNSYGEEKVEAILREFESKALETKEILGKPVVSETIPDTTNATGTPDGSPVSAE